MIKVIRAYDTSNNDMHVFSVMADDSGFSYVFLDDKKPMFDSSRRVEEILSRVTSDKSSLTVDDYLRIATFGLGYFMFSKSIEESSKKIAIKSEKLAMERSMQESNGAAMSAVVASRYDDMYQVLIDYPDLADQLSNGDPDAEVDAPGMTELIFAALGSVDPNGPNGWLVDYIDGKESEGYVGPIVFGTQESAGAPANDKTGNK